MSAANNLPISIGDLHGLLPSMNGNSNCQTDSGSIIYKAGVFITIMDYTLSLYFKVGNRIEQHRTIFKSSISVYAGLVKAVTH